MFVAFATTLPIITATLLIALGFGLVYGWRWRSLAAKKLYLAHCDVALACPQFANPELGKIDLRDKSFDGEKMQFERYEWYVARLVYALDECLALNPFGQWKTVADTQLGNHRHYFASDYYAKQGYLAHYSRHMRQMIQQQRKAA